jgi:hypothetical protein
MAVALEVMRLAWRMTTLNRSGMPADCKASVSKDGRHDHLRKTEMHPLHDGLKQHGHLDFAELLLGHAQSLAAQQSRRPIFFNAM